jgi:hypothetical protein
MFYETTGNLLSFQEILVCSQLENTVWDFVLTFQKVSVTNPLAVFIVNICSCYSWRMGKVLSVYDFIMPFAR